MTDKDLEIRGKSVVVWEFCRDMENCDCLMSLKCPRGREVPGDNGCEDWDEEELIEAYRCIEGVL